MEPGSSRLHASCQQWHQLHASEPQCLCSQLYLVIHAVSEELLHLLKWARQLRLKNVPLVKVKKISE